MSGHNIRKQGVGFNAPLHEKDTVYETFGCRATNPGNCGNAYLDDICAFVRDDNICKRPSRQWKKQYDKLIEQEKII
jgi:hypothetical protein